MTKRYQIGLFLATFAEVLCGFINADFLLLFFSFQMQTASTLSRKFSATWTSSLCARQSASAIIGSSLSVVEKLGSSLSYICVNCENVGSFAFSMTNGKTDHTLFGRVFLLCLAGLLNMNCKTFQNFSPSLSIFNHSISKTHGTVDSTSYVLFFLFGNINSPARPILYKFLTLYGPYILESVVHNGFAFIKKGGFPHVKYGNNWHVKG